MVRVRLQQLLDAKTWAVCTDAEKLTLLSWNLYNKRKTITFAGTGIDDFSISGSYSGGTANATYEVVIDDAISSPNTFKWRKDGGVFTTGVAITGASQ